MHRSLPSLRIPAPGGVAPNRSTVLFSQSYPASTTWATAVFLFAASAHGVQHMGRRDTGRILDP